MDIYSKDTKTIKRIMRYGRLCLRRKLRRFGQIWHYVFPILILLPLLLTYGCSSLFKKPAPKKPMSQPVVVAPVTIENMPIYLSALGSVTPINNVTVKTQIDGQLLRVHFKDGQMVNAGDLLAEIDARPYEALLIQYQGQLARDKALLTNARIDLKRYETLYAQDSISEQTLATQRSLVDQYLGAIASDQGLIDTVKVNLLYCRILAPISGRLGLIEVDPGNIVQTSDTAGIVIINSMSPIYIDFAIPEDNLPSVAMKIAKGEEIMAIAQDRSQKHTLAVGKLLTTDNQIDTSTGTIMLRAQFTNEDQILFPNQFVNILLKINEATNALVIPTAAIQYGNDGTFVYVVDASNTVKMQSVKVIASLENKTAIEGTVVAGDKVVIEGSDKLKDGSLVSYEGSSA